MIINPHKFNVYTLVCLHILFCREKSAYEETSMCYEQLTWNCYSGRLSLSLSLSLSLYPSFLFSAIYYVIFLINPLLNFSNFRKIQASQLCVWVNLFWCYHGWSRQNFFDIKCNLLCFSYEPLLWIIWETQTSMDLYGVNIRCTRK